MDILRQIKIEYELSNLHWIEKEQVFQSDCGKRRVRIWKDKQLLNWHVKWRDDISRQSGFLLDRMIRTKDGDPFFISEKGWVSIHDEIEERFPSKGKEKEWGKLLSAILKKANETSESEQSFVTKTEVNLSIAKESMNKLPLLDHLTLLVLERSYFEAKKRIENALFLTKNIPPNNLPILPSFSSITEAKQIFLYLFWECGESYPVRGYSPLRKLLEEWYQKNGELSLINLLEEIELNFSLKGQQGRLLLAEFLMPYEFEKVITDLAFCKIESDKTKVMETYFKSWETSRKLVLILSEWIEKNREKVVAR